MRFATRSDSGRDRRLSRRGNPGRDPRSIRGLRRPGIAELDGNAYTGLVYFNEVDKGGHFTAWEQPQVFADEVRAGFRSLR